MKKNVFNSRRFKYGSLATVITVVFLAVLVLINVVATLLMERFPLTIDLTADKRFELTEDSIDLLGKLDRDITITVCADELTYASSSGEYSKLASEVIENYQKHSKHVTVQYVNLLENPGFAQNYPDLDLASYDILVESDLRAQKFSSNDLFEIGTSTYGGTTYRSKAEQTLTSAIMYVTDDNPETAILLQGQSSVDLSGYQSLLEANNIKTESKNLLTEDLGNEAKLLVLPQPDTDLTADQVKKLDAFLDNDGKFDKSLIFVASVTNPVGPILKNFLAEWGIEVGEEMIFETNSNYVLQNNYVAVNQIVDSDLSGKITNTNLPIVMPFSRPVTPLFEVEDNRTTRVLVQSLSSSILVPADVDESFDISAQQQKAYGTIVLGQRSKYVNNVETYSYVVAIGSEYLLSSDFLGTPTYGDSSMVTAITNLVAAKEESIQILPVDMTPTTITITNAQVIICQIVLVIVIPLLLLVAGIVVWLRRRHL